MPVNLLADDTENSASQPINLLADDTEATPKKPASLRDVALGALRNTLDPTKMYPFNVIKQAATAGTVIGEDVAKMIPAAGKEIKEGASPAFEQLKTDPKRFATNVLGGAAEAGRGIVNMPHDLPTYLAHLKLVDPALAEKVSSVIPQVPELESTINKMIGQDPNAADRLIRDTFKLMPVGTQAAGAAMKVAPAIGKEGMNIARSAAEMAENVAQAPVKMLGSKGNPILLANEKAKEAAIGQTGRELTEAEKAHATQQEAYNLATEEAKRKVNLADAGKIEYQLNNQTKLLDDLQNRSQVLKQQLTDMPDTPISPEKDLTAAQQAESAAKRVQENEDAIKRAEQHHEETGNALGRSEKEIGSYVNEGAAHRVRAAAAIDKRVKDIEDYWSDSYKEFEKKIPDATFHMPEEKVLSAADKDAEIIRRIKAGANPKTVEREMEAENKGMENPYYKELIKRAPNSTDTDFESFFTKHREFRDTLGGLKQDLKSENIPYLEKDKIREAVELAAEKEKQIKETLDAGLGEHKPEYDWLMNGYSTQVFPLRKNPVVKASRKGKLSKDIMEDLSSNESGMPLMREIVKQNPELTRNIIGQRFKNNPEEIYNPNELTLEYLQEHPQLLKMIENRNNFSQLQEQAKEGISQAKINHTLGKEQLTEANKAAKAASLENKRLEKEHAKEVKTQESNRAALEKKIANYQEKIDELNTKIPELETQLEKVRTEFEKKNITLKQKNELGMKMKHLRRELQDIRGQMEVQTSGLRKAFLIGKTMYRAAKKVTRGFDMFVRAPNPIWYLPDLTGEPLNDEYYAFFLTNTLPYIPQAVYRDNQGMTVWTNSVLQFYPNGTLPDNLYFDPALVYRIEVRHGNSQTDALIYEINDFVPGASNSIITSAVSILFAENQISNGNFSQVNFSRTILSSVPTITITTAGVHEIAPGWFLSLTGAGSTTLTQNIYSGSSVTSQPNALNYSLRIANSGWSGVTLYQRFENNGNIFAGGAINVSLVGRAITSNQPFTVTYAPSDAATQTTLISTTMTIGNFATYSGTMNLPDPDNTDLSSVAYTDIVVTLPPAGTVEITDVQVVGQNTPLLQANGTPYPVQTLISTINPEYQQATEERNLDHLFHYYAESLVAQPKNSLLAGWNFALNPWQFTTTAMTNVANNGYHAADQTIMIQQAYVAATTPNNIAVGQAINTNNFALQINAVTATNQFGILQYIDTATIAPYWGKTLSAMVKVRLSTINGSQIAMKMRLFSKDALPVGTTSQTVPVSAWVSGSDPVFAAGFTAIIPENDPIFILNSATEQTFSFNRFTLPACASDTQTLGIMFYSITDMAIAGTPDTIFIDDVSLVHNDFALPTQPQTFDEVLQACQYYYEKSYDQYVLPGASTAVSCLNFVMFVATGGGFVNSKAWPFGFRFNTVKRAIPTLHLRSTTGVIDQVTITNRTNAIARGTASVADTFWTPVPGTKGVSAIVVATGDLLNVADGGSVTAPTAEITFHYTADARLGI